MNKGKRVKGDTGVPSTEEGCVVTQIVLASSPAGEKYLQLMHFVHCLIYHEPPLICEGANFGTGLSTILENDESAKLTDWLHRNDNYVLGRRGPRTLLSGPLPTFGEEGQRINHILNFCNLRNKSHLHTFYCAYIILLHIYMMTFICISCVATM
jgi:hypothetical protein